MRRIELPELDRLPDGPHRELVLALRVLYQGAGNRSLRKIVGDVRADDDYDDTVSYETVRTMLRGDSLPRWEKLEPVVRVLALRHTPRLDPVAEAKRMQKLWHAAQGHTDLDETARDLANVPAAALPASGVIGVPVDPAGPTQWESNEPPAISGLLPHSRTRSARDVLPQLGMRLWSCAGLWRLAAVVFVTVVAGIAGASTDPHPTGSVASESFQITAAVDGNEPVAFAVTSAHVLEFDSFRNGAGSGWRPLPGGGQYLGTPATVTDSTGQLEVFARTSNKTIVRFYQSAPGADAWHGPQPLGTEQFTSDPAVVNWPGHGLVVFARGTGGLLGIDSQAGTGLTASWSGWHPFGTIAIGQPVAVANHGDGHPEVFAIASGGGSLVHAYDQGNGWNGWSALASGGAFTGVPAVDKDATGRVEVLVRTTSGSLESFWQEHPGYGAWNQAYPIGSGIVGDAELVAVDGQLEVFAEHAGGSLEYSTQLQADSAAWSAWTSLPGKAGGVPAVVYASGRTDILASVGGNVCDIQSVSTSGWSNWRPLNGTS